MCHKKKKHASKDKGNEKNQDHTSRIAKENGENCTICTCTYEERYIYVMFTCKCMFHKKLHSHNKMRNK